MSANKIRIGIVLGTDFQGRDGGGSQPAVKIFLKFAQERPFDIFLLGMSTSKDEPVGQLSKRVIYGREYPFIPLFFHDTERYANRKPLVPVRIQTFLAYALRRRLVDSLQLDILYLHAPQALPFFWSKRQPILYQMHNPQDAEIIYSRYAIARTRAFGHIYRMVVRTILEKADQFIIIDQESYDLYTKQMPGRRERFHLLPISIDSDQFRPILDLDRREARARFGLPAEGKILLCVGRLAWKKGVDLVLRAFSLVASQVPDAFLAIAGDGDERPKLTALVHQLGLDERVFFLGYIPQPPNPNLPRLYNCTDGLVLGSFHESLALVLAEALACGKPVISTPVGIAPQVIQDGVTGYLVQSREPAEMSIRMRQVLGGVEFDPSTCVEAARKYAGASEQICDVIEKMRSAKRKVSVNAPTAA
ncbi:MAG TPA: glycosyltransferase family 4 protein [Candidatus Acidoferrum sp.]|nr:glycosyltransferase family 4 protein [Candidatus Acidoferrum sp.]